MAKPHLDPHRGYRGRCAPRRGETAFQVVVEQTDLWIVAGRDLSREALDLARAARGPLKAWIELHPEYAASLTPLETPDTAPEMVRAMARAGAACGVGPMAAVAGAVAQRVAQGLAPLSREVLVENGGDLYLLSSRERVVGLLSDPAQDATLGLRFAPEDFPLALCSSSARIGHSLSLGQGDLVAVRSVDGALADAAATALCNRLRKASDLDAVLRQAEQWRPLGVDGVLAQCGGKLAAWGKMELTVI